MSQSIANILDIVDTLLNIPRIGWLQRGVPRAVAESVGEHTLLVSYVALIMCSEVRRSGVDIDVGKCLAMALLHDAHEALIGNVGNGVRSMVTNWRDIEARVFEGLGLGEELSRYFREYRFELSVEGKLVNIADKLATYMRACKYARAGYSTEELINNYKKLITRLINELPSSIKESISKVVTLAHSWCVTSR